MNVKDFLNESDDSLSIGYIASGSVHKNYAKDTLNAFIMETPAYYSSAYILSRLPLLLWAETERAKHIGRFPISLADEWIFDLSRRAIREVYSSLIKTEDKSYMKVLFALHMYAEDVSGFLMAKYYRDAADSLFRDTFKPVNTICKEMGESFDKLSLEDQITFHDANLLFRLNTGEDADARTILLDGAECIKSYPIEGKDISKSLRDNIIGCPRAKTGKEIGRSRTYIAARVEEGKIILPMLYWGLTDKESLLGFRRAMKWM